MCQNCDGKPASESAHAHTGHAPLPESGEGCIEILADRLREWPGVLAIEANFRSSTLTVRYQPALVSPEQLNTFADEVGGVFAQRVTTCEKRDTLEACSECALRFGQLGPDAAAQFAAAATPGTVRIARRRGGDAGAGVVDGVEVVRPLSDKPWGAPMSHEEEEEHSSGGAMVAMTIACLVTLLAGFVIEKLTNLPDLWSHLLYGAAAVTGGWFATVSTFEALRKFKFDVNLLMILAAVGAAATGAIFEAAVLMFLFSLSNTLEVYTMGRTRHALNALMKLRPARALVRRDGKEIEVAAEDVRVGETVIVKPGEAIPVDGTVTLGTSLVDQSSLTGESVPVEKGPDAPLYAGTLNQHGALEFTATRAASNSALARIVALVQEAQEQKSRTEEVAEWVGRYYTIVVIVAAVLMLLVTLFVLKLDWNGPSGALYRTMTLLVVASPCALVIATPATILSAIANAARNGILFKGGRFIEALGRVKAIAFDKTGTLTHGRFEVTDVIALQGGTEEELLALAACAEKRSPHPLAQAVVRAAEARRVTFEPASELHNHLGKGLVASHGGRTIQVGTPDLFVSLGIALPSGIVERVRAFSEDAKTAMVVHSDGVWGLIAAADVVRPNASETVKTLRSLGISHLAVLSGDSAQTVDAIARRTGVDERHGQLLPEDKVRVIGELEAKYGSVAMIGDGVNDAPALARASVGIAMGGIGSDAAMESADVVLMADDLSSLPYAVQLAKRANRVVIQNLVIATGVMLFLVVWTLVGTMTPLGQLKLPIAVSGHEGSTVVVILNGLRLLAGRRAHA
ncbi:MAG: cadmium-translocating P-type ATPase [Candidatus Eisenbacteria bacterium]|nr:cadmium-translocating P-type ATPase [Candidatus Eisenbacteria bacterium]